MAFGIKHLFVSPKADGLDPTLLQPSYWNADHTIVVPAASLVGRAQATEGAAEVVSIGSGLELDPDTKVLSSKASVLAETDVVVGTAPAVPADMPNYRVLTSTPTVAWDKTTDNEMKASIPNGAVDLARLEAGVQGNILYYGTAGAAARLAPGLVGQALVAAGAGANPGWSYQGGPHAVIESRRSSGTSDGTFTSGAWQTRFLNSITFDPFNIVGSLAANRFQLVAGLYIVEWSAPAWRVNNHQTRLMNITDAVILNYGLSSNSENSTGSTTVSTGLARFTVAASKDLELQHQCQTSRATDDMGVASGFGVSLSEVFSIVKIWKMN